MYIIAGILGITLLAFLPRIICYRRACKRANNYPEHANMVWAMYYTMWRDPRADGYWSKVNET